jgi:hypothetical protein
MSLSDLATKTNDRPGPIARALRQKDAFAAATIPCERVGEAGEGRASAAAPLARFRKAALVRAASRPYARRRKLKMKVPPKRQWRVAASSGDPQRAVDDSYATAWTAEAADRPWFEIDLGAVAAPAFGRHLCFDTIIDHRAALQCRRGCPWRKQSSCQS